MQLPLLLNSTSSDSVVRAICSLPQQEPSVVLHSSLRQELSLRMTSFSRQRAEPTVVLLRLEHRKRVVRARGWRLPLVLAAVTLVGSASAAGVSRGAWPRIVHELAAVHVARLFGSSLP